ncbi:cytidine deaminase-like [Mytilus californianus]|uniref:cytidine deaminase-like n=1 Tax=Mytilus californianus TaxID=6549 RepID=UPI002247A9B3|nr:cytidine deaminase-like [Mytilus californianus]
MTTCTMNFQSLDQPIQDLINAAVKAKDNAYCPYSDFHVGSAVLTEDGHIFSGANVENASYGLSICAERVAICKAISEGKKNIKAIAVNCDVKNEFKGSCGACRQFFVEFNMKMDIYMVKPDLTVKRVTAEELLPMSFNPKSLQEERIP